MSANKTKINNILSDSLPWEEISNILKKDEIQKIFKSIHMDTFRFATKKENLPKVIESALKNLKKTDPAHATREHAESLANMMHIFAKMVNSEIEVVKRELKEKK